MNINLLKTNNTTTDKRAAYYEKLALQLDKLYHDIDAGKLGADAKTLIEEDIKRKVRVMAKRCKDGNVKRLTGDLYFIAIGKL